MRTIWRHTTEPSAKSVFQTAGENADGKGRLRAVPGEAVLKEKP